MAYLPSFIVFISVVSLISLCAIVNADSTNRTLDKEHCKTVKQKFMEDNVELLRCAVEHAEPVTFCQGCIDRYLSFNVSYYDIVSNETCRTMYVDRDRLNLLLTVHSQSESLWAAGSCSECFRYVNGSLTNEVNQITIDFFTKYNATRNCIQLTSPKDICTECLGNYSDLNDHYNELKNRFLEDNMCFDIRDAMNATRLQWSQELRCCKQRKESLAAFFAISGLMALVPVMFYVGFFMHQRRIEASEYLSQIEPDEPSPTSAGTAQRQLSNNVPDTSLSSNGTIASSSKRTASQSKENNGAPPKHKLNQTDSDDTDDELQADKPTHSPKLNQILPIKENLLLDHDTDAEKENNLNVDTKPSPGDSKIFLK